GDAARCACAQGLENRHGSALRARRRRGTQRSRLGEARAAILRVLVPGKLIGRILRALTCFYIVWVPVEMNAMAERPLTILCVSSYEKGQEFLRTCKRMGCRVLLLTVEKLRNGDWPREAIDEMFFMPEELPQANLINAVSYAARNRKIDRIVALDEFD